MAHISWFVHEMLFAVARVGLLTQSVTNLLSHRPASLKAKIVKNTPPEQTSPYTCCTTRYTIGLLRKSKVQHNSAHFIPCDLIFLLCPLMYGLVCSDGVKNRAVVDTLSSTVSGHSCSVDRNM